MRIASCAAVMRTGLLTGAALLLLFTAALWPAGRLAAAPSAIPPARCTLGGVELRLLAPQGHGWVDKNADLGLKLAPKRYKKVIGHVLSLYSYGSFNSLGKAYNNYGALFFVGPSEKVWTGEDFAELKKRLFKAGPPDAARPASESEAAGGEAAREELYGERLAETEAGPLEENAEYLRDLLRQGMGYKVSSNKALKYFNQVRRASLLHETADSLVAALRHKEKGQKEKQVTVSLALIRGKLVGTAYYQVSPSRAERERAAELTRAWQGSLLNANEIRES